MTLCVFVGFFFPHSCNNCSSSRGSLCLSVCALSGSLRRLLCHLADTHTRFLRYVDVEFLRRQRGHLSESLHPSGWPVWVLFDPNKKGVRHSKTMLRARLGRYLHTCNSIENSGPSQTTKGCAGAKILFHLFFSKNIWQFCDFSRFQARANFLSCNKQLTENNL